MIQAIQVLRFHLLELEKVSRKQQSPFWWPPHSLSQMTGMFHVSRMKDYSSGDVDHVPIFLLYRLLNPGTQRMWESGQPCLLKPPTPRHSGLFEVQQEPFVLLRTMSSCVSISSAYPRPRVPELGASRRNSPLWGVCALISQSIIPPGNMHNTLLMKSQVPPVLGFTCFRVVIKSYFRLCSPHLNPVTCSPVSFFIVTCCSGESLANVASLSCHNCSIVSLPSALTPLN